jgi:hypothetical protein
MIPIESGEIDLFWDTTGSIQVTTHKGSFLPFFTHETFLWLCSMASIVVIDDYFQLVILFQNTCSRELA